MRRIKKAFTMIELIFVIVIIGILSAVAMPRLAATRDDAKVSILAKAIQTVKSEITTSIIASNQVPTTTFEMRQISNTVNELSSFVVVNDKVINIIDTDNTEVCKVLTINDSNSSNILLVLTNGTGTSAICLGLQSLIASSNISYTISGNIVNY